MSGDKIFYDVARNILTSQNLTGWGHLMSGLSHLAPEKNNEGSVLTHKQQVHAPRIENIWDMNVGVR